MVKICRLLYGPQQMYKLIQKRKSIRMYDSINNYMNITTVLYLTETKLRLERQQDLC